MTTMENAEIMKTISELRKQVAVLKQCAQTPYMQKLVHELDESISGLEKSLREEPNALRDA